MVSARHWNVQRHIRLMHALVGEPVDHITGSTRSQLQGRVGMNYMYTNIQSPTSPLYKSREKRRSSYFHTYNNNHKDDKYDRNKRDWDVLDKMKDLKLLETLNEIQQNSQQILRQNMLIISELAKLIDGRRF